MDRATLVGDYLSQNRPVVMHIESEAFREHWELGALRSRYGQVAIEAEETASVYVGERDLVARPLGPMIDALMRGDTDVRWKGLEFLSKIPAMREELRTRPPPFQALLPAHTRKPRSTLWVAPKGTMSSLHHDGNFDNVNMQISGEKLWLLIPPPYHRALHFYGSAESPINPFVADPARFPQFANARPVEALLRPGDALLVPKYWWHCVYAVEPSVNLATCFSWDGELTPWEVLRGAPLMHRSLTALSAEMKRRGLGRLADATRRAWWSLYQRVTPRVRPEPRTRLTDI